MLSIPNLTRVILFDVDGVLIKPPHYFSRELENKGYQKVVENLDPFFHSTPNHFCLEGKADAEQMIAPFLKKFGWPGTAKNHLQQQFQFESQFLDKNFIRQIQRLRQSGILCCLSTDQEKHRAEFLLTEMKFKDIFSKAYISCYIGYRKCQDKFWDYVLQDLKKDMVNLQPAEITYFDDTLANVGVASKFGIRAFLFKDVEQFNRDLNAKVI